MLLVPTLLAATVATTLVTGATPAAALPSSGAWSAAIDDYAGYVGEDGCSTEPMPGTVDFRTLLQEEYGANGGGITRECTSATSEHHEGRAYDWMLDAGSASDRQEADEVLDWLLATDRYGNRHAMARRLGLMYIVWNGQVWKSYQADRGWQPYSGYSDHTDHIHFSFSWPGARRETTYWTQAGDASRGGTTVLGGDFDADGTSDVARFDTGTGDWTVGLSTGDSLEASRWSNFRTRTGWQSHVVGDFDGDGRDDVLSYHTGTGRWWLNRSTGSTFELQLWHTFRTSGGWSHHLVGDFDGDDRADVASHHGPTARWWLSTSTGSSFSSVLAATSHAEGTWQDHLVADVDGHGTDELLSFDTGSGDWVVQRVDGDGFDGQVWGSFPTHSGWGTHVVGDFTGSGTDDVASYHPSNGTWWVSTVTAPATLEFSRWDRWRTLDGWSAPVVDDVDADGRDDLVSHHAGAGSVWVSRAGSGEFEGARWHRLDTDTRWTRLLEGEFSNDGVADVAALDMSRAQWWVGTSSGTTFDGSVW